MNSPVHFPKDPKKFEFDSTVAPLFENMAARSIPNFWEAHDAHVYMAKEWLQKPGVTVFDAGASRGSLFRTIKAQHQLALESGAIRLTALDNSVAMCRLLAMDFPHAEILEQDLTSAEFTERTSQRYFDIVCANYTIQFLPPEEQEITLVRLLNMVEPGGVFLFGHKAKHYGREGELAHAEYIRFRMRNGYSLEEIAAKTEALKGSMFVMEHRRVLELLEGRFDVQETTRFMMFSTLFAIRRGG